jgi:hypothetical protein
MPFFLKSREKAVSHGQFRCYDSHVHRIALKVRQSAQYFILRLPKSFLPPRSSRRQGVGLTIASSLSETGGVTHFGLCVLAVSAVSRGSVGGRVRVLGTYVVTLVSVGMGSSSSSLCSSQDWSLRRCVRLRQEKRKCPCTPTRIWSRTEPEVSRLLHD